MGINSYEKCGNKLTHEEWESRFLVSHSFYLHFYPQFSNQINDNYGNDSFHQSNIFHGKRFYTWIFVNDHWISELWPLKLNEVM